MGPGEPARESERGKKRKRKKEVYRADRKRLSMASCDPCRGRENVMHFAVKNNEKNVLQMLSLLHKGQTKSNLSRTLRKKLLFITIPL